VLGNDQSLREYPVVVNPRSLLVFGFCQMRPPSSIERLARLQDPALAPPAVRYVRGATMIRCAFFALNGIIAAYTAAFGRLE
jgi:uncharacterized membrane protein